MLAVHGSWPMPHVSIRHACRSVCTQVGLEIKDCGECVYCLDKPRYGGKGTKRQKCINKKVPSIAPIKAWAALRVTSLQQLAVIEE